MSDHWLKFVPTEPTAKPSQKQAKAAHKFLEKVFPEADKISIEFKDNITFIDPGENWSGVNCPFCNTTLEDWWQNQMSTAWKNRFNDLAVILPCCNKASSLNELNYIWPAAFGSFTISALNPDIAQFAPSLHKQLTQILGLQTKLIFSRY